MYKWGYFPLGDLAMEDLNSAYGLTFTVLSHSVQCKKRYITQSARASQIVAYDRKHSFDCLTIMTISKGKITKFTGHLITECCHYSNIII